MRKFILLLLVVTAFGCSKNNNVEEKDPDMGKVITQKGIISAPKWMIGEWKSEYAYPIRISNTGDLIHFRSGTKAINITKLSKDNDYDSVQFKDNKLFYFTLKTDRLDPMFASPFNYVEYRYEKLSVDSMLHSVIHFKYDDKGNRVYPPKKLIREPTIYTKIK